MASIWAKVKDQFDSTNPPPASTVWADSQASPDMSSMPLAATPKVSYAPTDPMDQQIENTQERLGKLQAPVTPFHDLRTGGKIKRAFSTLGNVAGDVVAPEIMARIPGTQLYNETHETALNKRLQEEEKGKAENAQSTETAKHLAAETPEVHPNAVSARNLEDVQAQNILHPHRSFEATQFLTPEGQPVGFEKTSGEFSANGPEGLRYGRIQDKFSQVSGTLNGKPFKAGWDPVNHIFIDPDTGAQITGFQPQPQIGALGPILETPEGKVIRATPGNTVPTGSMTPGQAGSLYQPTGPEKLAAGRAQIVLKRMPETLALLDQNEAQLGPALGRWNEFMQGKGGFNAPGFAQLRTDLMMMSTAVAMLHAVGRLPENLRVEFDNMINAPKQTAGNLKAVLNDMRPWIEDTAELATPGANQGVDLGFPKANIPEQNQQGFKVRLSDAMALPENKGKSEADVEADVKKHGGQVVR